MAALQLYKCNCDVRPVIIVALGNAQHAWMDGHLQLSGRNGDLFSFLSRVGMETGWLDVEMAFLLRPL